jgi:hypothetical protein
VYTLFQIIIIIIIIIIIRTTITVSLTADGHTFLWACRVLVGVENRFETKFTEK